MIAPPVNIQGQPTLAQVTLHRGPIAAAYPATIGGAAAAAYVGNRLYGTDYPALLTGREPNPDLRRADQRNLAVATLLTSPESFRRDIYPAISPVEFRNALDPAYDGPPLSESALRAAGAWSAPGGAAEMFSQRLRATRELLTDEARRRRHNEAQRVFSLELARPITRLLDTAAPINIQHRSQLD